MVFAMFLIVAAVAAAVPCLCGQAAAAIPPIPAPLWFTQNVDHFDFRVTATFQQRVLVNEDQYRKGGAILFYCGLGMVFSACSEADTRKQATRATSASSTRTRGLSSMLHPSSMPRSCLQSTATLDRRTGSFVLFCFLLFSFFFLVFLSLVLFSRRG